MDQQKTKVLGIMSGTSMDGVDLALVEFEKNKKWNVIASKTYPYDKAIRSRIDSSIHLTGLDLSMLDRDLGKLYGELSKKFMLEFNIKADFIASHGHTVFHQPDIGLTVQIGHPGVLAATAETPVVADFRSQDVALGGQGAPLVPKGDSDLFSKYTACLNLGGIANISYCENGKRIAGDITVCNMALNKISERLGQEFDDEGKIARCGKVVLEMLTKLTGLSFHMVPFPKSTGREWFEKEVLPLLNEKYSARDILATLIELITSVIASHLNKLNKGEVLVTGGGARNEYLISCLREKCRSSIIVPDDVLIDFKEAIIFAYLGFLRVKEEESILRTSTGASREVSAGCIYLA